MTDGPPPATLSASLISTLLTAVSLLLLPQINEVIEVRVVEVEVVVVDGQGRPVPGLTKGDFELREGGKVREVTNFYAVARGQLLRDGGPPKTATETAVAAADEPPIPAPPTHIVFFVDDDHLDLRQRNRVLAAVRRFADANLKAGVDASLITYDHEAKVRVPFTADRARIAAELEALEREPARLNEQLSERRSIMRSIDDAREDPDQLWRSVLRFATEQSRQVENSLLAVSAAVRRLRGVPGRRILVHVSSGLPLRPGVELMDYWRQRFKADPGMVNMASLQFEESNNFKRMIADAQAAGVIIDTIDAGGLTGFEGSAVDMPSSGAAVLDSGLARDNRRDPLRLIADETGGRAVINENDFDRALSAVASDTTTYYSLGFHGDGNSSLRRVDVRVKRPGLTVRSAKAYRERSFEERLRDTLESAFDFPLDANPLAVELQIGPATAAGNDVDVPLQLRVAPSKLTVLEGKAHVRCYYEVREAGGGASALRTIDDDLTIAGGDAGIPAAIPLKAVSGLRLRKGNYTLSLAVRDLLSNETSYIQRTVDTR